MFCKHCIFGKQCRKKFNAGSHVSKGILDYIHLDLWGPSPTISYGRASYYVMFIDDFSRKVWVYILKRKADLFDTFKQFKVIMEKRTGRTIKCLTTDNGGEFTSFILLRSVYICFVSYDPFIFAERMNRNLLERARSMLRNANMGQELWAEAVSTA